MILRGAHFFKIMVRVLMLPLVLFSFRVNILKYMLLFIQQFESTTKHSLSCIKKLSRCLLRNLRMMCNRDRIVEVQASNCSVTIWRVFGQAQFEKENSWKYIFVKVSIATPTNCEKL